MKFSNLAFSISLCLINISNQSNSKIVADRGVETITNVPVIFNETDNEINVILSSGNNTKLVFNNSVDITANGYKNVGIAAWDSSIIELNGTTTLDITGNDSFGIFAYRYSPKILSNGILNITVDGSNSKAVVASGSGNIVISGPATLNVKGGGNSAGVFSLNPTSNVSFENNLNITTQGNGLVGDGGSISVDGKLVIDMLGSDSRGIQSIYNSSKILLGDTLNISAQGNSNILLMASKTGAINVQGPTNLNINGDNSRAIFSYDENTMVLFQDILNIKSIGNGNNLIGSGSGTVQVNGKTTIDIKGNSSTGVSSAYSTGKVFIEDSLDITTTGDNNSGLSAERQTNIQVKGPTYLQFNGNNNKSINNATGSVITLLGNFISTGDTIAFNNNNNSTINFFGATSSFAGNAINDISTISLSNGILGGRLNIGGDYTGKNGLLILDTDLADDNSLTDFVEIGGKALGVTKVDINSGNSRGAKTVNGIKIIQTQSSKDTVFVLAGQKGYITAGGKYDYYLEYREKNSSMNNTNYDNFYLMNYYQDDYIYTPDIGEYLATETMGNTLFTSRLEDREGASQYQNLGNSKDVGNVWVRAYGGHNQFKTMNSQLKTTGNSFVTQMGTALVTLGEQDQYNLGAMTGFAYYDGKTRSSLTDRESKTKIDGYSLGFYGTWYAHPVEQRGTYIDSWVLWNKFNNSIDTPDYNKYKFNSSGVTASLEVGGDYLINKNGKKNWWVQPQSQIIYQGVHAENFQDAQGVDVYHGKDNVQMRIGIKTYLDIPTSGNKFTSYRPYVALNYIQNTNPYSVVIHDERYENEGSEKQGEIKFGIEGNTTKNSQVWLNASYATGSHNNEVYQGNIGWKYNF